jgi:hypothetical protein
MTGLGLVADAPDLAFLVAHQNLISYIYPYKLAKRL